MFPWVCRIRKELLYHLPAHFPGHWMQSLIWQILLLTVFFSSDFTDSPAFPENLVQGGRMSTLLLLFLQQAKHCISLQNLSDKVDFCDSPHSLWPALSCGRRGGPWARSLVQGNAGTLWKHWACLGYSPALGMSQRPCTGARHLSLGGGDAQGNQQKGLLFRGTASLWLWPHETFFLEVCLYKQRTTSSAVDAIIFSSSPLRGPRNASDARTLQERALIFLRQLCSPYKTVYCANNKCGAYLQSLTLADWKREAASSSLTENHGGLIGSNKTSVSLFPRSKGITRGTGQSDFSQVTRMLVWGGCCRPIRTETERQIKSCCSAMPWMSIQGGILRVNKNHNLFPSCFACINLRKATQMCFVGVIEGR